MDRNFARALSAVLKYEGGYVDHPSDPGGATNMGITRKTLANWRNVHPYTSLPKSEVKALGQAEAAAIYKASYWDAIRGDDLPSGVDLAVFDLAVNSGPGRAAKTLQRLIGAPEDGKIGPVTLAAVANVHAANMASLINAYCDARMTFLQGLSTFSTFGKGWAARVKAVRAEAIAMASETPAKPIPAPVDFTPASIPTQTLPEPTQSRGLAGWLIIAALVVAAVAVAILIPLFH